MRAFFYRVFSFLFFVCVFSVRSVLFFCYKNVIKMKLKTNTSLLVLYVCYWPGLEDRSSGMVKNVV